MSFSTRQLNSLSLDDLSKCLGSRSSRKIANNTYVERDYKGQICIRLHATVILTYHSDGSFTVRTGGYQTVTTKQRLNALMPCGYRIYSKSYRWMISTPEGDFTFSDGDRFNVTGELDQISSSLGGEPVEWEPVKQEKVSALDFEDMYYGDIRENDYVS